MYIGIDLGGTNIAAGLVTDTGQVIEKISKLTNAPRPPKGIMDDMVDLCNQLMITSKTKVLGIGIGVPGPVNADCSVLYGCVNIGWGEVRLKELMEEKMDLPFYIDNDANLAALAEFITGALKGVENGALITLGTGVGGGLILNNKLYRGTNGLGTEIGHLYMGDNFYDCECGRNGCFETFASAKSLGKYAKYLLSASEERQTYKNSALHQLEQITAKDIFEWKKKGDLCAKKVFDRFIKYLCAGIGNLVNLLDLEIIALGGGISEAGEALIKPVNDALPNYLLAPQYPHAKIVLASSGNDAGIIGAGLLAKMVMQENDVYSME